jgi:sterol desaturase/sphingolipid hydroxylase (fatty acid hydroxylase superfamily)
MFFNVFVFGVVFGWAVLTYQTVSNAIIGTLVAGFGRPAPPELVSRSVITLMLFLAYELGYWFNHWLSHRVAVCGNSTRCIIRRKCSRR